MNNGLNMALIALFFMMAFTLGGGIQSPPEVYGSSTLLADDCVKCHAVIVEDLQAGNSKHESKVSCIDCHSGSHPPKAKKGDLIPACSKCHKDTAHFELPNCMNCHHNPHQPLNIILEGEGQKPACNTCHPDKVTEVNTHLTSHTGFSCSFCHTKHRDRPNCLTCHKAHVEGQVFEDCIKCHQAHQPLTLMYTTDIPNSDCGGCHPDIRKTLESGDTKHAKFQCIFCHADKHGIVPACTQCHKSPHNKEMVHHFETCNACHQTAHDILK